MGNTFGNLFRLTSFGESHGEAVGGVVDGMPSGVFIDHAFIQNELNRRKPGQSRITTARKEQDEVVFLSGIYEGKTTGCPIGFYVKNTQAHSHDYANLAHLYRPSHADYTYHSKYGNRDYRGGGRSSARITLARCVAGALAKLVLRQHNISIQAYVSQVGNIALPHDYTRYDLSQTESNAVRCPDPDIARQMEALILKTKGAGNTIGGVITGVIKGCPVGLGMPEFHKLHADLGAAMLSINAVKGFEYGMGFAGTSGLGSELNDAFVVSHNHIHTQTNHSGGIQGGISNGEDIYFRVGFKPVATLLMPQQTVTDTGKPIEFTARGRHDSCVVPRAVPIVEAMAAMVLLDHYLLYRAYQPLL